MARSHHRHKKYHPVQYHPAGSRSKRKTASTVFIIFLGLFGLGIGYFAAGTVAALIIGALAGGIIGYFIVYNLDRMANKK
jgi:outer membrane lipoprotein SlyB